MTEILKRNDEAASKAELENFLARLRAIRWFEPPGPIDHSLLQTLIDNHYQRANESPFPIRVVEGKYSLPHSNGLNTTGRNTSNGLGIGMHLTYTRITPERVEAATMAQDAAERLNIAGRAVAAFGDTHLGKFIGMVTTIHISHCAQWIVNRNTMRERGFVENPLEPLIGIYELGFHSAGPHVSKAGEVEHLIFKPRTK